MRALSFRVAGLPIPQGSKTAFPVKGSRKINIVEANIKLPGWRELVALQARRAVVHHGQWLPLEKGVVVGLRFYLPRPPSVKREIRPLMTSKPDIDKLTRAILDSMTTAQVYGDDAKVVELHVYKNYADDHPVGVHITVEEAPIPE